MIPRLVRRAWDFLNSTAGAVIAAAAVIVVILIVAFSGGDDEPGRSGQPNPTSPVSAQELSAASKSFKRPIYWAGRQGTSKFELTRMGNERIAVRYLTDGADPAAGSLTVATYALDDAVAAVRRAGRAPTATLHKVRGGGVAVSDTARPTNVYLAFRGQPYQVEVFDPKPGRALRLVRGGRIRPVP